MFRKKQQKLNFTANEPTASKSGAREGKRDRETRKQTKITNISVASRFFLKRCTILNKILADENLKSIDAALLSVKFEKLFRKYSMVHIATQLRYRGIASNHSQVQVRLQHIVKMFGIHRLFVFN